MTLIQKMNETTNRYPSRSHQNLNETHEDYDAGDSQRMRGLHLHSVLVEPRRSNNQAVTIQFARVLSIDRNDVYKWSRGTGKKDDVNKIIENNFHYP